MTKSSNFPEIVANNPKYKIGNKVTISRIASLEDELLISGINTCVLNTIKLYIGKEFIIRNNKHDISHFKNLIHLYLNFGFEHYSSLWVSLASIEDPEKLLKTYKCYIPKWKKINWNY